MAAAACGSKMPVSSRPLPGAAAARVERVLALGDGDAFGFEEEAAQALRDRGGFVEDALEGLVDAAAGTPDRARVAPARVGDGVGDVGREVDGFADQLVEISEVDHQRVARLERAGGIHRRTQLGFERLGHVGGAEHGLEGQERIACAVDAAAGALERRWPEKETALVDIEHRRREQGMFGARNGADRQRLYADFQRQERIETDARLRQRGAEVDADARPVVALAFPVIHALPPTSRSRRAAGAPDLVPTHRLWKREPLVRQAYSQAACLVDPALRGASVITPGAAGAGWRAGRPGRSG